MKRRILCLAVALCMIAALLPMTALAATPTKAGFSVNSGSRTMTSWNASEEIYAKTTESGGVDWSATASDYNIAIRYDSSTGFDITFKDAYLRTVDSGTYTSPVVVITTPLKITITLEGNNIIESTNASYGLACLYLAADQGATITGTGTLTATNKGNTNVTNSKDPITDATKAANGSTIICKNDLTIQNATLIVNQAQTQISLSAAYYYHGIQCAGNLLIDDANVTITTNIGSGISMSTDYKGSSRVSGKTVTIQNGANVTITASQHGIRLDSSNIVIDANNGTEVTVTASTYATGKIFEVLPQLIGSYTATAGTSADDAKGYDNSIEHTYFHLIGETAEPDSADFEQQVSPVVGNDLTLNFRVKKDLADKANGTQVKIERNGTSNFVSLGAHVTDGGVDYYVVSYTGIAAKEMGDEVTVTVCGADGTPVGNPYTDSIAEYATRHLNDGNDLATLCADLLHYGAMAQTYFGYEVTNLVNEGVTGGTASMESCSTAAATIEGEASLYAGTRFDLEYRIGMDMKIAKTIGENCYAKVSFTDHNGIAQAAVTLYPGSDADHYYFSFNGLAAADGRCDVTWDFYVDNNKVLTVTDSMERYVGRNLNQYSNLKLEKLMNYSDSAAAYFKSI